MYMDVHTSTAQAPDRRKIHSLWIFVRVFPQELLVSVRITAALAAYSSHGKETTPRWPSVPRALSPSA